MKTFYGSLRVLEQKFISHITDIQPGPGRSVLVLCPSGRVAAQLRKQLVLTRGIISNIHLMTLSDLLANLDREAAGPRLPLLPGDNLHDYILKKVVSQPGLNLYPIHRGFLSALKSSLRDLADGLATADTLEEYIQTTDRKGIADAKEHLLWLTRVFKAYGQQMEQVPGYRSYQTYFTQALAQAEDSAWLRSFAEIILYGFYDLTGRQLELLQVLRANYALTVFWLYCNLPAFQFGHKFFDTHIRGLSSEIEELPLSASGSVAGEGLPCLFSTQTAEQTPAGIRFISAPNAQREVSFVAKEIVRLHEEENIAYVDMAVVAHSLQPYQTLLPDTFRQHAIALQADFSFSWQTRPLGVFVMNLLSLARNGFDREDLLAIVNSPYFKHKNEWRYLIQASLAKRDYAQWTDLVRKELPHYDEDFLSWLKQTKKQLEQLEQSNSWEALRQITLDLLQSNTQVDNFSSEEQRIWQSMLEVLEGFKRYNVVSKQAKEREFLDELLAILQTLQVHQVQSISSGVTVAEVSAMRGLHFKVIFLLSMNEKSFPQLVREDPILKDACRIGLRDDLGFWLSQKLERIDEERLLFFNMVEAAENKLYLSFLRADEEGKPIPLSSYIVELARATQADLKTQMEYVPFHWERNLADDFTRLTKKEMSWSLAVLKTPLENYQIAGISDDMLEPRWQAAKQISSVGALTERDGMIGSGKEIWQAQNKQGFSPSALQELAHCPFKYFLSKAVGLKEADDVLSRSELAPNLRGDMYHAILKDYYEHLYQEGLAGQLFNSALQERLDRSLASHYQPGAYKAFGIYPVIWDLILTDIHQKLSAFIQKDAEKLETYVPSIFETYFEKIYAPTKEMKLKLKGIIDRIDIDSVHKTFRIIDYKSSKHGGQDLAEDMFKCVILQPFIYLILAQGAAQTKDLQPDGAYLLNISPAYSKQELTQAGFESIQKRAAEFFDFLMNLICDGKFFIQPGDSCQYCSYAAICRKDSFYTRLRVQHANIAQRLEEMKK